ncbi:hypothetical protein [Sphingomonas sp. 22176]|uniref:hypothetical protein n=1 Tax=Sphingomonas sp. 22176 TaxID=3453884 RepID=UPI003F8246D8
MHKGLPQLYGSQAACSEGRTVILPMVNEAAANHERALIGWAQTLEETKGDLEIGKPCRL